MLGDFNTPWRSPLAEGNLPLPGLPACDGLSKQARLSIDKGEKQ
jgi:hypothetical protein